MAIDKRELDNQFIEQEAEEQYKEAKANFNYPKGVKDNAAFDSYLQFKKQWTEHKLRYFTTKDKKTLDLALNPEKLELKIQEFKLSKTDAENVRKINKEIYFIVQKSILLKEKAFGDNKVLLTEKGFVADELAGCESLIIELNGKYYQPEEIRKILIEELDVTSISLYQINKVIASNQDRIVELRQKYTQDYSEIRLGYKKSRLEELSDIYRERKIVWQDKHSISDEQQLTKLLELIKKEVEGDLTINAKLDVKVESQADEYIQKQMMKSLNVQQFILSRIAARLNINPILLLSRLAHSRYAQFTGLGAPLSSTRETDEIEYASELTYDWTKIKTNNEALVEEEKKIGALPEVKNEDNMMSLKEKLRNALHEAKKPLEEGKDAIKKPK